MKKFVPKDVEEKKKDRSYLKIDQYKSPQGLVSVCLGIGVFLLLQALFAVSYSQKGNAGMWIGGCGIGLLVLGVTGIVFAILGFRDPDAKNDRSYVGCVINGIVLLWLVFLYVQNL